MCIWRVLSTSDCRVPRLSFAQTQCVQETAWQAVPGVCLAQEFVCMVWLSSELYKTEGRADLQVKIGSSSLSLEHPAPPLSSWC